MNKQCLQLGMIHFRVHAFRLEYTSSTGGVRKYICLSVEIYFRF